MDARKAISSPMSAAETRRVRVLIVEDHKDVADSLAKLLSISGFEVQVANSGHEGLRLARINPPDCVLSDIGLPDLNGYQMAEQFRKDEALKGIPLVALTAYPDPDKAMAAGFNEHLLKPADFETLKDVVRKLVNMSSRLERTEALVQAQGETIAEAKDVMKEVKEGVKELKQELREVKEDVKAVQNELSQIKEELQDESD